MTIKVLNEFLPNAEIQRVGAIKVGDTLEITQDEGVLNVDPTSVVSAYYSNIITEIPQNIKLELNDGVLTLKAGSKVYAPNGKNVDGSNKFNEIVIESDLTKEYNVAGKWFICYDVNAKGLRIRLISESYSGTTTPTATTNSYWYNTTDNKIGVSGDKGATWSYNQSFPLCIVTLNGTQITSIDQVFNGFGYIGSTVFALPGVKGLIPNGKNEDGTLKNIEFTVDKVITRTITWNNVAGQALFIGKYNLNEDIKFISTGYINTYFQQEDEPSLSSNYAMWYKPSENKIYRVEIVSEGEEVVWKENFSCYIGQWFSTAVSPYPITELTTRLPFRAVDYSDAVLNHGNQDIGGNKNFTGGLTRGGKAVVVQNDRILRITDTTNNSSTTPTSNSNSGVVFYGTDGTQTGEAIQTYTTGGTISLRLGMRRQVNNAWTYSYLSTNLASNGTDSLSASNGVKASIVDWGNPAYGSAVSVSNSGSYTAPSSGWLFFTITGSSGGETSANIGSVQVAYGWYTNTGVGARINIPMSKGDTITWNTGRITGTIQFVKRKGG